jgi:hypothetical protein
MAEKLSVQIELSGGAEIARQLEGIGEAGQKAFADIAKSAEQVGGFNNLKPDEVTAKLNEMGVTGVDAIDKIQKAVQSARRLESLVQGITSVETALMAAARAAPIVGAAIVAAMTAAAKATIALAAEINKINDQAIKLGAPIEKVDQFRAALEKAGVSAQSIGQILQSKLASEQGVQGLEAFIRQLQQMPDSAARSKAAIQEFGQAGAELIRILQAGGKLTGFAVGGLISADDAKRATELGIAINQLESSIARLNTLGFAPALTVGINVVTSAVEVLGARLQQTPWSTFFNIANLGLSPIASLISTINRAISALSPPIQQVGIATQQASGLFTQWGTAADAAGKQAETGARKATVMFTSYGTVVGEATTKTQTFGSALVGIAWDTISGAAVAAWNALVQAITGAGTAITDFVSKLASITWDAISGAGVAAWNALTGAIQAAIDKVLQFIGLKPSGPATGEGASGKARGGMIGGRGTGTSDSNLAWLSRGEFVVRAAAVRKYGAGLFAALNAQRFADGGLVGGGGTEKVTLRVEDITKAIADNTDAINSQSSVIIELGRIIGGLAQTVGGLVETVSGLAQQQGQLVQAIGALMDKVSGKASGGLLGGRGTGTSDSNLAWVSRGEHIMPARAVAQPGVLAFLEALRRSGGNLSRVLDGMGRFALGGLVPRMPIPAFAAGGMVGGGNLGTLTLGLPSGGSVTVRASASVAEQLRQEAALAQVRSGGRKPSRYS